MTSTSNNNGITLQQLADRVLDVATRKADYIVPARKMAFVANPLDGSVRMDASPRDTDGIIDGLLDRHAYGQACAILNVPKRYADMLRASDDRDVNTLLGTSLTTLARASDGRHLIRTLGDPDAAPGINPHVRAILSDRYRRIDNEEVVERIVPAIPDGFGVASANVSPAYMYLKFVRETELDVDPRLGGLKIGVEIRNSEVGAGALTIRPTLFRLVCLNGMTSTKAQRFVHLGSRDERDGHVPYADATLALEDRAMLAKVADAIRWAVSDQVADDLIGSVNAAAGSTTVRRPDQAVERLADRWDLTDERKGNILRHLATGGDLSRWGMTNAITRAAQDEDTYDQRAEMEALGGQALAMPVREWEAVAA